ncbi:MAG: arylesterase, partial [Nitrospinota bacterium]|nr:arylesterase [Nitrospinota bacterium]
AFQVKLVNAGVSGDTTAGGLSRLDWALGDNPAIAVVELGENDGLRGLKPKQTEANLDAILEKLKKRGVLVLLTGMYAPPNMGRAFGRRFNAIFPRLAEKHNVLFYRFFLEGVAGKPALNQADGLHPNEKGAAIIARRLYPYVRKLVEIAQR